jgi:hypothetical protein
MIIKTGKSAWIRNGLAPWNRIRNRTEVKSRIRIQIHIETNADLQHWRKDNKNTGERIIKKHWRKDNKKTLEKG